MVCQQYKRVLNTQKPKSLEPNKITQTKQDSLKKKIIYNKTIVYIKKLHLFWSKMFSNVMQNILLKIFSFYHVRLCK